MPRELKGMNFHANAVAKALPDFFGSTVAHRLKQVAQKNLSPSRAYLSQSLDPAMDVTSRTNHLWTQMGSSARSKDESED